jgi:excinuclease ABC subunit C
MKSELKLKLANLPTGPGVYLFINKEGNYIYIGKAKNLRSRVKSYFNSSSALDPKTARMTSKIDDIELMVTDSEIEALILEANLIKEYRPRYNVNLKDDKHFPYIKVTVNEPFPRLLIVRRLANDGARYFGPYTNSYGMRKTVRFLNRLFKIRNCSLTIPHPSGKKQKICLDYHIGRCAGPCEELQTEEEYRRGIDNVLLFLSGRSETLINKLEEEMRRAAENLEYERAAELRDQAEALRSVIQKQKVDTGQLVSRDILAFAREASDTIVVVMQVREGILIGRQDFQLRSEPDESDEQILAGFIQQYYNNQPNLPEEMYLPITMSDQELIGDWLSAAAGFRVKITTPQKGEKVRLVEMASRNARLLLDEILIQKKKLRERTARSVQILKKDLHLLDSPVSIACVDISNTGESDAVGSFVYFTNGKPLKSEYRHFRIKGVEGQNDFAMMREVVGRYFFRLKEEKKAAPVLLVVDGGKGQLSSVVKEISGIGFPGQNVIGLAKRLEEIYLPGHKEPLTISKSSPGLKLLKRVRDEAHRFAIEYNRKLSSKRTIRSELDRLPGIGPKRRELLLKHFGSLKKMGEASLEELRQVKGIPENVAEIIYRAFSRK